MSSERELPRERVWLACVVALAVAVRVLGWDNWSLWLDEAIQVGIAKLGLAGCLRKVAEDGVHPPLDYLVTWLVLRIRATDAALRAAPTLWSALTVVALWIRFGRERRDAAIGAGIAFALLPIAIHYGQEVRPYALALFLVAAADAARERHAVDGRRLTLVLCALFSVLAAFTHYFALVLLGAIFATELAVAFRDRRVAPARLRAALAVPALTALLFLPWVAVIHARLGQPWEAKPAAIDADLVRSYLVGFAVDWKPAAAWPVAAGVLWTLAAVGVLRARGEERLRLLVELFAATVGVFALLALTRHWWDLRYGYFAVLPFCRAVGEALAWAAGRLRLPRPAYALAAAAGLLALESGGIRENVRHARADWRGPFVYLSEHRSPGDAVIAADPWAYLCLRGQTLRRPGIQVDGFAMDAAALRRLLVAHRTGWLVRSPAWQAPAALDDLLGTALPSARFAAADAASIYRFEGGRLASAAPGGSPTEAGAFACWLPAVVHAGAWRTDLSVLNEGSAPVRLRLTVDTRALRGDAVLELGAARQETLVDVARAVVREDGAWPLHLTASAPVTVAARTFAAGGQGVRGAAVPCVAPSALLGAGESAVLAGLRQTANHRTNIGLANTGRAAASVRVQLFSGGGAEVGSYEERIGPGEWSQRVEPFRRAGEAAVPDGWARVRVESGAGVIAAASVIDDRTDDPTIVVASRSGAPPPAP